MVTTELLKYRNMEFTVMESGPEPNLGFLLYHIIICEEKTDHNSRTL